MDQNFQNVLLDEDKVRIFENGKNIIVYVTVKDINGINVVEGKGNGDAEPNLLAKDVVVNDLPVEVVINKNI